MRVFNIYTIHVTQTLLMTAEADKLWLEIRGRYVTVLNLIRREDIMEFYIQIRSTSAGPFRMADPNAAHIINSLYDNAVGAEHRILDNLILISLIAFHDPVVDKFIRAPNQTTIESKMQIGHMREQTYKILRAYNLGYLACQNMVHCV